MTDEEITECFTSLGKAFAERRDLRKQEKLLNNRLRSFSQALLVLVDNPLHAESMKIVENGMDPISDWQTMKSAHGRLSQLDRILTE